MRLLITGAGGLLGVNLALAYAHAHTVVGMTRSRLGSAPFEQLSVDLTESGAFERALSQARPDAVIHCAAMADVDACERDPDGARRVNADVPAAVARACKRAGVKLIHISTDAVFDGTLSAPYTETDRPNPTSVYARTKLIAEGAVLDVHPTAIVARVNFYGWSPSGRRSLAEFFVNNLSAGMRVKGFTDVYFCPLHATDLADVLIRMLDLNLSGLYHAVGPEYMSKHDFGVALAGAFHLDPRLIDPDSVETAGLAATRSLNLHLSIHKLSTALGAELPPFSTGLARFQRQFLDGYPQLIRSFQQVSASGGLSGSEREPQARAERA